MPLQTTHYAHQDSTTNPFPTLTQPLSTSSRTSFQAFDLTAPRSSTDKDIDSSESDTMTSATPRAQSDIEFGAQYHHASGSGVGYNVEEWINPTPYQGMSSLSIHSPVTPVPPSPSTFSQASERSPLSAHAERDSPSFMAFSQGAVTHQQQGGGYRPQSHLGGNNQTPLMSLSGTTGMGLGTPAYGRARAPSAPTYPQLQANTTNASPSFGGPMSDGTIGSTNIALSRQLQQTARPSYTRSAGSGPVFGTGSSAAANANVNVMGTGVANAPPAMMQAQRESLVRSQPIRYGYRYPVPPQSATPAAYLGFDAPSSLPSLTSGSTASSSASLSSGASAAGDAPWARASVTAQSSLRTCATNDDTPEDEGMEEDKDAMGGWGHVSDPLPTLMPSSSSTSVQSMYAAAPQNLPQHAYGAQGQAAPLGFPAPMGR